MLGDEAIDGPALKVAAMVVSGREGTEVSLLHVIEVPFDKTLDAEDERRPWHAPRRSSPPPRRC